jgi:hypothetical protein
LPCSISHSISQYNFSFSPFQFLHTPNQSIPTLPNFSQTKILKPSRIPTRTSTPRTSPCILRITITPLILALGTRTLIAILPTIRHFPRGITLTALRIRVQTRLFLVIARIFASLRHGTLGVGTAGSGVRFGVELEPVPRGVVGVQVVAG